MNEGDGQLHTLTVLEQLREASKGLWGASSAVYFRVDELLRQLANPNLHDIPRNLPFRVEMWDGSDQHIRWVIAASASVAVGRAAMDAAIANYPGQRFTLRKGRWSYGSIGEASLSSPSVRLISSIFQPVRGAGSLNAPCTSASFKHVISISSLNGLARKPNAPAATARARAFISGKAVTKMIGKR